MEKLEKDYQLKQSLLLLLEEARTQCTEDLLERLVYQCDLVSGTKTSFIHDLFLTVINHVFNYLTNNNFFLSNVEESTLLSSIEFLCAYIITHYYTDKRSLLGIIELYNSCKTHYSEKYVVFNLKRLDILAVYAASILVSFDDNYLTLIDKQIKDLITVPKIFEFSTTMMNKFPLKTEINKQKAPSSTANLLWNEMIFENFPTVTVYEVVTFFRQSYLLILKLRPLLIRRASYFLSLAAFYTLVSTAKAQLYAANEVLTLLLPIESRKTSSYRQKQLRGEKNSWLSQDILDTLERLSLALDLCDRCKAESLIVQLTEKFQDTDVEVKAACSLLAELLPLVLIRLLATTITALTLGDLMNLLSLKSKEEFDELIQKSKDESFSEVCGVHVDVDYQNVATLTIISKIGSNAYNWEESGKESLLVLVNLLNKMIDQLQTKSMSVQDI